MRFTDTNVLLYAAIEAPEDAGKRRIASELLQQADLCLSVQVLQEFYYQATRITRPNHLSHEEALRFIEPLLSLRIQPLTVHVFLAGAEFSRRYRLSYWDGAILAAARDLGTRRSIPKT